MIVLDMSVQYICPECGKTGNYSVYGLHEKIEKLYEKNIKHHVGNECMECHKAETVVRYAEMKLVKSIFISDTRHRYELNWYCKDCGREWLQYKYLAKKEIKSRDIAVAMKNSTNCTCGNSNRDFFLKSFVQKLL